MKASFSNSISFFTVIICFGLLSGSCKRAPEDNTGKSNTPKEIVILKDYGPEATVLNIEQYTSENTNFRTALWTGQNLQVTLMNIPVNGEVGLELHDNIDQFLRIEEGKGRVMMGNAKDSLDFIKDVSEDVAVIVPAGKWHNIINIGDKPLKLYSIYSPVEHPHGTVHKTSKESIEAEHHH